MSEFRVASRYAKSLLELSIEKGILEEVHQDMMRLLEIEKSHNDFSMAMKSPVIKSDKKLSILKAIFGQKISQLTLAFFEILSRKGRENALGGIAREFHKQYNLHQDIQLAKVVTPAAIDRKIKDSLIEIVKEISGKSSVELIEKIDEDLIGGFILKIEDRQIDESLSSRLKKLQLQFTENLYEKKY